MESDTLVAPTFFRSRATADPGSNITITVPPRTKGGSGLKTKITELKYTAGDGDDFVTCLRAFNKTTVLADAAAGQKDVYLTEDPGDYTGKRTADNPIAVGDYLTFQCPDGSFYTDIVDDVAGAVSPTGWGITMTNDLPTLGLEEGAPVWFHGAPGDTDPNTARTTPVLKLLSASSPETITSNEASIFESLRPAEPLVLVVDNSANVTASSVIEYVAGVYGP